MKTRAIPSFTLPLALLAALELAGCGALPVSVPPPADAGPGVDAGVAPAPDAGLEGDEAVRDGGTPPDAGVLPAMVMPSFIVGYNEAWFGPHFGTGLTTDFDPAYVDHVLDGIAAGGGKVVRVFLFELLQGISLGPATPRTQGVSPQMLANVDLLLHKARQRGLWVYFTGLESNQMALVPEAPYYRDLLTNTGGEQDAFHQHVLGPLLGVLDAHQDNVFGYDISNEIDAAKSDGVAGLPLDTSGPRAFIRRTRDFIKSRSPWLRVTCTVGKGGTAQYDLISGFLSGLGLDFYDVHLYSDDATYGGQSALCARASQDGVPLYIGEFGQKTEVWSDAVQYNVTAGFLYGARNSCFAGALAWRFDAAESTWAFELADGGMRPAAQLMQLYGSLP